MLLCSRNSRPQKALVGRAHSEHNRRPRFFVTQRRGERGIRPAWLGPLCSRNPHGEAVVVRRAQVGPIQASRREPVGVGNG